MLISCLGNYPLQFLGILEILEAGFRTWLSPRFDLVENKTTNRLFVTDKNRILCRVVQAIIISIISLYVPYFSKVFGINILCAFSSSLWAPWFPCTRCFYYLHYGHHHSCAVEPPVVPPCEEATDDLRIHLWLHPPDHLHHYYVHLHLLFCDGFGGESHQRFLNPSFDCMSSYVTFIVCIIVQFGYSMLFSFSPFFQLFIIAICSFTCLFVMWFLSIFALVAFYRTNPSGQ